MPAINFQARWADAVQIGATLANGWATPPNPCHPKRTTIRRPGRARAGQMLYLYTGQRTAACRKLGEVLCLGVTPVSIDADWAGLKLNGLMLSANQCETLARLDTAGLWGYEQLMAFFREAYGIQREFELISW